MFRFTIRDVFWLTALVALAVGWWVDRRHFVEAYYGARLSYALEFDENEKLRNRIREIGGTLPERMSDEALDAAAKGIRRRPPFGAETNP